MKEELAKKISEDELFLNVAYTDYGGDFFEKVLIEYFKENDPEHILYESTIYCGQNAVIFGDFIEEFCAVTDNYLLGWDDLEEFYTNLEYKQTVEAFECFIEDSLVFEDYQFNKEKVMNWLMEQKYGQFSMYPNMLDFCSSDLTEELEAENLITKKGVKN